MTPIQIQALFHYADSVAKLYPDSDREIVELTEFGLISNGWKTPSGYALTELGQSHLAQLCSIRLPVPAKQYVYPSFEMDFPEKAKGE